MDVLWLIVFGVIAFISGAGTIIFGFWRLKKDAIIEEILENVIADVSQNEEMQKSIYQIGGILGSGVKGGIGLELPQRSRGGKFKVQDMLIDLAAQFISTKIANPSPSPAPLTSPLQGVKTGKDKFFNT